MNLFWNIRDIIKKEKKRTITKGGNKFDSRIKFEIILCTDNTKKLIAECTKKCSFFEKL